MRQTLCRHIQVVAAANHWQPLIPLGEHGHVHTSVPHRMRATYLTGAECFALPASRSGTVQLFAVVVLHASCLLFTAIIGLKLCALSYCIFAGRQALRPDVMQQQQLQQQSKLLTRPWQQKQAGTGWTFGCSQVLTGCF